MWRLRRLAVRSCRPLFANLLFDRLAALPSRAVNAPPQNGCFVGLFDQVVDCRLLYVPLADTPWRGDSHSHSTTRCGQVRAPELEGVAFRWGVSATDVAVPRSVEAIAVPVVSAGCRAASAFRADLPLRNSMWVRRSAGAAASDIVGADQHRPIGIEQSGVQLLSSSKFYHLPVRIKYSS